MAGISKVGKKGLQDGALTTTAASAPTVGAKGELFYNTAENKLYVSNGTIWTRVSNDAPSATGGTVVISTLNEGDTFSYNLGTNFTDDSSTDAELTYALESGTLPGGATLPTSGNSAMTGTVGNVSSNTVYTFSIRATDTAGATATQDYQQQINTVVATTTGGTVTISSVNEGSSASYDVDTNFTFNTGSTFSAYSLVSGALPSGLSLNTSTGVISGTMGNVSVATAYSFTIRATDTDGDTADQAYSWSILAIDGSTSALAITTSNHISNITTSGAKWFTVGGSTFQTYVDINLSGKGAWALVRKVGAGGTNQTGGAYRLVAARGNVTNTTMAGNNTDNDSLSRDQINGLFRLNANAGILTLDFITNGCNGANTGYFYYLKKVTNRTTFDAWHGLLNAYLWGDMNQNSTASLVSGGNTAWRGWSNKSASTDWNSSYTDFTHREGSLEGWDAHSYSISGWTSSTIYVSRHGPIVTDWDAGCQWVWRHNANYESAGRVWVKL
jgi:hypothetical protein